MIRRWQIYAKDDAVLETSGRSFEDVRLNRLQKCHALSSAEIEIKDHGPTASDDLRAAPLKNDAEQFRPLSPILDLPLSHKAERWDGWHD